MWLHHILITGISKSGAKDWSTGRVFAGEECYLCNVSLEALVIFFVRVTDKKHLPKDVIEAKAVDLASCFAGAFIINTYKDISEWQTTSGLQDAVHKRPAPPLCQSVSVLYKGLLGDQPRQHG